MGTRSLLILLLIVDGNAFTASNSVLRLTSKGRPNPRHFTPSARPTLVAQGFGATSTKAARRPSKSRAGRASKTRGPGAEQNDGLEQQLADLEKSGSSIANYLNPNLFEDPSTLEDVGQRLRAGEVVVLRDAFHPAFAEAMYGELRSKAIPWDLNEGYFEDGYAYHHRNVYESKKFTPRLKKAFEIFNNADSKQWIEKLSGRDCAGDAVGAPSWYKPGDHSLPHTDWAGQRTVAYVWHLSKNWRPEWGGGLYWCQNPHNEASFAASFNTLVLFCVTTTSAHFVTCVSRHAKEKRLAFNGWWQAGWEPSMGSLTDIEDVLMDNDRSKMLTHTQLQQMTDIITDPWQNINAERRERLDTRRKELLKQLQI